MEQNVKKKIGEAAICVALTYVGFKYIPSLISRMSSKLYKTTLKRDSIDFNNLGPEIVKKSHQEVERYEH